MTSGFSDTERCWFVLTLQNIDACWGEIVGGEAYYDLHYSDLFTRLWLSRDRSPRKTELYDFMPRVSRRTAVKYVDRAIREGLLVQETDPVDRRSKRVSLSPELLKRIESFLDRSLEILSTPSVMDANFAVGSNS